MRNAADLAAVVARVAQAAERHRGRNLTEQDTKNALIEPVLAVLGWPKDDLDLVRAEYRHTSKYNPVDYALLSAGRPVMLVEAKALDVPVNDHKVVSQVLSYAVDIGVEWALVTNGADWHLYSALAQLDAARKRVFAVCVSEEHAVQWLPWIAPPRLAGNMLGNLWHLVHAERQVRATVNRLLAERNDALVTLIAAEAHVPPADVALALQVLQPSMHEASMNALGSLIAQRSPGAAVSSGTQAAPPATNAASNAELAVAAATDLALGAPASAGPAASVAGQGSSPGPSAPLAVPKVGSSGSPSASPPAAAAGGVGSPVSVRPTPGSKPEHFSLGAQSWEVTTWGHVLLKAAEHLHAVQPQRYDALFSAPEFEGREGRRFSRKADGMRAPKPVPGGFVDLNLSAGAIVGQVAQLLRFFGLPPEYGRYSIRPSPGDGPSP